MYVLLCNLVVGVGFRYLHVLALKMIKREGFFTALSEIHIAYYSSLR